MIKVIKKTYSLTNNTLFSSSKIFILFIVFWENYVFILKNSHFWEFDCLCVLRLMTSVQPFYWFLFYAIHFVVQCVFQWLFPWKMLMNYANKRLKRTGKYADFHNILNFICEWILIYQISWKAYMTIPLLSFRVSVVSMFWFLRIYPPLFLLYSKRFDLK